MKEVEMMINEDDESYPFLYNLYSDRPSRHTPSTPVCLSKQKLSSNGDNNIRVVQDIKSLLSVEENGIFNILPRHGSCLDCCSTCSSPWTHDENGFMVRQERLYLFNETIICTGEQTLNLCFS